MTSVSGVATGLLACGAEEVSQTKLAVLGGEPAFSAALHARRVFQLPTGSSLDVETVTRIGALLGGIVSPVAEVRSSLKRRSVPSA